MEEALKYAKMFAEEVGRAEGRTEGNQARIKETVRCMLAKKYLWPEISEIRPFSTFTNMLEHQDQKIPRSVACPNCLRHKEQCICEKVVHLKNKTRVVVLQHPQEQFKQFNSAKLLSLSLENSELVVGLSWQNHRAVLGEDCQPGEWGVLHLKGGKDPSGPPLEVFRKGKAKDPKDCGLKGIIVLDGSWKQAKTLWWRNPWLLRLNRVSLNPAHASLRNQVRPDKLSTLEAASMVLELMGEAHSVQQSLLEQYRTLIIEPSKS